MKRFTIGLTLLFALINTGCEDKDDTPAYIDCEWAYWWGANPYDGRIDGNLIYLMETERPEITSSTYWSDGVIWIHYFAEEKRFEFETRQDGSIIVIELSAQTNFQYKAK